MDVKQAVRTLETITKTKYRRTNTGWLGLCPVHQDSNPSLVVSEGKNGQAIWHCFGGCDWKEVEQAIVSQTCFYDPAEVTVDTRPPWEKTPIAVYDYKNAAGKLLYQKLRFENKEFATRRPHNGGWKWSLNGIEPVLYRLPEVIAAKTVAIVEGEKDADSLVALGLTATTNYEGSSKWKPENNKYFEGKHVLVFADNDRVGVKHAKEVFTSLKKTRSKTLMHPLPGLSHKQDVTNWLNLGNTLEDLKNLWQIYHQSGNSS